MVQSTITAPLTPGDILADKYRVERLLGLGGMGVVVAAWHIELEERVAIKFLLPQMLSNADAVNRFAREARSAVKIKSQHVVRTLDVGRLDNGAPYMVMEYLDGMDLATRLAERGPLSVEEAVTFTLQTCEALAAAHAVGVIHRDLKPANLFITRATDGTECIKVLDFGISKFTGASGGAPAVTSTLAMIGSPLYMAPEQMASPRNVDLRCDIWSLGVTLYECLTKTQPFLGDNIADVCSKVASAPTPSVRAHKPEVPPGLDRVVQRCLEKDAQRRFSNVAELALALSEFAPRRARQSADRASRVLAAAGLSTTPDPGLRSTSSSDDPIASAWGNTKSPSRPRMRVVIAAALGIAVLGLVTHRLVETRHSAALPANSVASTAAEPSGPSATAQVANAPPSSADPIRLTSTDDLRSEAKPANSSSTRNAGRAPSRATYSAKVSGTQPQSKSTPQSTAKPIASSRLPNLGGIGREF